MSELDLPDVTFVGHSVASMMGVLAVATDPSRFAKLVLLTPSPRYVDEGDYRGGFSRSDIDELLESLESNYLGWSRTMAPVIHGELLSDLSWETNWGTTSSVAPTRSARGSSRAPHSSVTIGADLQRVSVPTLVIECEQDAIAPREVGALRSPTHREQQAGHAEHNGPLPAPQRSGGHCPGDRRFRHSAVSIEDLYENAPCGYISAVEDRRILMVNKDAGRDWLGVSTVRALVGKGVHRT